MMLDTIHHVAVIGSDYQRSRHFYVDLLGFEVVRENYRAQRNDWKIDLKCGQQEIELFIIQGCPPRPSYPEALGLRHLAFRVPNIREAVERLAQQGIETQPIRIDPYTQTSMTFFFDPDGLPLELRE